MFTKITLNVQRTWKSVTNRKMLEIKQQERCAMHFEAYFVMLPLPHINLPSVGVCSSNHWALHFSIHPSLVTHPPSIGHQAFYLPVKGGAILAGQEKYLASWNLRLNSCAVYELSLRNQLELDTRHQTHTHTHAAWNHYLDWKSIQAVSQRTIHPRQLRHSLVYQFPWCQWILWCRIIVDFIKWADCTVSDSW